MLNRKFILLLIFGLTSLYSFSQCAMCKAVVETDLEAGGTKGAGLNDGILYLMSMPYLAILVFGVFYILQKRKRGQSI
tara:strand:+ start:512 stop:745 length:234 start_codon:yes stop_codon:yes gene_type:complete